MHHILVSAYSVGFIDPSKKNCVIDTGQCDHSPVKIRLAQECDYCVIRAYSKTGYFRRLRIPLPDLRDYFLCDIVEILFLTGAARKSLFPLGRPVLPVCGIHHKGCILLFSMKSAR